jgi:hypothetical protein
MRNALAGFLASGFTVRRGLQADLPHLRCRLPVMVQTARRGAVGLLPDMHHFMRESGQNGFIGASGKAVWVHCQSTAPSFSHSSTSIAQIRSNRPLCC